MDVLLVYCDSRAPSRALRFLEVGVAHQVLADNSFTVSSLLLENDAGTSFLLERSAADVPRLVAFACDEFNVRKVLAAAEELHAAQPQVRICALGIQPILGPERIMSSRAVSYMVVGEPEMGLLELTSRLDNPADLQAVRNLWWRTNGKIERNPLRPLQENLDLLPYADRSLFEQDPLTTPETESILYVAATRGCPFDCLFCYSPVLKKAYEGKGTYYRCRSAGHLTGEILGEVRRKKHREIVFVDELFPTDRTFLKILAQRLGGTEPIPFTCTVVMERCEKDTLQLLHAAGCRRIVLGVETGNEAFRKRMAGKNNGNEKLTAFVASARELGIKIVFTQVIGLPLESEQLLQETYRFNQQVAPDEIRCTVYQPIESTQLFHYIRDKQYMSSAVPPSPDFTQPVLQLPELQNEVLRTYLYRMHFLNVVRKLDAYPKAGGTFDFIANLKQAKFRLPHSHAVDVGLARRRDHPFAYMTIENGAETRYPLSPRPNSILRFSLMIPQASFLMMMKAQLRLTCEVLWIEEGRQEVIFCRLVDPHQTNLTHRWNDCVAALPEDASTGELTFRVATSPSSELRIPAFWGMPALVEQQGGISGLGATPETVKDDTELRDSRERLTNAETQLFDLQTQLDKKSKRVAELHVSLIETEKKLEEAIRELNQLRAERESGLSGKLKGLFKK